MSPTAPPSPSSVASGGSASSGFRRRRLLRHRSCLHQTFVAVLPLVLFLYLVQVTERTQLFFLGKLHAFAIPQKEEYIVKKSPRAPDVSVEDCIALNTSDRIFRPRAFAQFMVIPHSVPRAFLKGAAQTLAFETQKQLVTSNSKDPNFRIRSPPHEGILFGKRGFGFCKQLSNLTTFHVAILRDPLERVAGSFREIKLNYDIPGETLDEAVRIFKNTTLKRKRIKEISPFWMLLNQQVDYMCGYDCIEAISSGPLRGAVKLRYLHRSPTTRLNQALSNLAKLDAVGIYGKSNEFLEQLGFYVPVFDRHKRPLEPSTTTIHGLSHESVTTLKKLLQSEYRLYNAGIERATRITQLAVACKRHQAP